MKNHAFNIFLADTNVCSADPCMNGGTCELQDNGNNFNCICTDGFSGLRCESGKDTQKGKYVIAQICLLGMAGIRFMYVSVYFDIYSGTTKSKFNLNKWWYLHGWI